MTDYTGKKIAANYFRGKMAVGGRVTFGESALTFHPHLFNLSHKDETIAYADMQTVGGRDTLGLVSNGVLIVTKDGTEHKFVVNGRDKVVEFLQSKLTPAAQ